jgi:hypothetical protein
MHCGHGWIMGKDGKRWHPCRSQDALLADLSTINKPFQLSLNIQTKHFCSQLRDVVQPIQALTGTFRQNVTASILVSWPLTKCGN